MDPARILQGLYDTEVNSIVAFWDAGFEVKLGDDLNGFVAEAHVKSVAEAAEWLRAQAVEHYPESVFAKAYGG
ncbi:hypothetical protein QA641_15015 [Bradyrhizobium sp. CB1650]|uniref:hypothetical protein n=1 Tax=Bradyrhizobium sp. CB1650 TaxID=3039153 RepID=UPI0024348D40|nr:hypothetical protein [Bradyrhizobium sp. CB1650]WGD55086.1 hypothetical protein QA641_15015 [Bradyrhizobium sp. CB1650]